MTTCRLLSKFKTQLDRISEILYSKLLQSTLQIMNQQRMITVRESHLSIRRVYLRRIGERGKAWFGNCSLQIVKGQANIKELTEILLYLMANEVDIIKGYNLLIAGNFANPFSLEGKKIPVIQWSKLINAAKSYNFYLAYIFQSSLHDAMPQGFCLENFFDDVFIRNLVSYQKYSKLFDLFIKISLQRNK